MFTSISSRLWLSYLVVVALILVVVTLAQVVFLARNPRLAREAESNLMLAANALERQRIALDDRANLQQAIENADELLDVRIAVYDPGGSLIADSRAATEEGIALGPPQGRRGGPLEILELGDSSGETWLYTTRMLPGGYTLLVATPRPSAPLRAIFSDELFPPILRAGLLALLLSLILSFALTRWITNPLQRVSAAAQDLAEGQSRPIVPEGPDEVQSLARTFNDMTAKVTASQQSQRDFVANISHELRTPLTSIQGFAQAILDGTAKSGKTLAQAAQVIYDEAGRMGRLVQELLELARLDAGTLQLEKQAVDISQLLNELGDRFRPQANSANIEFSIETQPLPLIQAERDRLVQVLSNLIDNAITHTPRGGRVILMAHMKDGNVEITVSDTGAGIPPKEAERIFERFYQVEKSRRGGKGHGVGLGLPIALQIVRAHGGSMRVESEEGKGSRFIVVLPIPPKGE